TGACGANISPTFQLTDGSQNLGTVSFSLVLGQVVTLFSENFDGVIAPSLPAGWTTAATGAQSSWVSSTAPRDTSPNAAFSPDPGFVGLNELDSPVINLTATTAQLTFRHSYSLETASILGFDGGVLEIKIGGGAFTDILAAGGSFVGGGYDHTLSTDFQNPLPGRQAWSGDSGGFITTIVNLPPSAQGQAIQLRWRCGTDPGGDSIGWFVDTASIHVRACCGQVSATTNSPPTVAITSPINGASFIAPASITIQADASDSNGSVTNVQFFDGETSLGNAS